MKLRMTVVFGILVSCAALVVGCGSGSVSSINGVPVSGGMLSGRVTASGTISASERPGMTVRALFNVASAAIWLQEHPEIRTTTAPDGSFVLENVPFGTSRVVANLKTQNNKTYKTRSEPIVVSTEEPSQDVGQLSVEVANNKAKIILRDANGQPVCKYPRNPDHG